MQLETHVVFNLHNFVSLALHKAGCARENVRTSLPSRRSPPPPMDAPAASHSFCTSP